MRLAAGLLLAGFAAASAHNSLREAKTAAEAHLPYPHRPLAWGDVNFVSTTDIHNWLLGHQHATWPEPNYSGDAGDLLSFLTHMRKEAKRNGRDLLLIDSGDHHDGPGIGSVSLAAADQCDEWLSKLGYDVLAIGNHELYRYEVTRDVWRGQKRWNGRYLTSNVNITVDGISQPVGKQYIKFETATGRRVTAFGVLYGFQANPPNVTIQAPAEMIQEEWFQAAIAERPDFFILAGHMAIRGKGADFDLVHGAIRERHPDVPVFIFGGHTHIRDCLQLDGRSMSLESGRYMETVGWMSANLTTSGPLEISRRYLDQNRRTYKYHTGESRHFDTPHGLSMSEDMRSTLHNLNLSRVIGTVPEDYFLARVSFPEPNSVLTKLMYDVLPAVVHDPSVDTPGRQRLYIVNSGSQRFDIFKGPFTVDDVFVIAPFVNTFELFTIRASVAKHVAKRMNDNGASQLQPSSERAYEAWMQDQWREFDQRRHGLQAVFQPPRSLGYVTKDRCGGGGDDVLHEPVPRGTFLPEYVESPLPDTLKDDDLVDVVILHFFANDFVRAVNELDPKAHLHESDAIPYSSTAPKLNDVWQLYAERFWN